MRQSQRLDRPLQRLSSQVLHLPLVVALPMFFGLITLTVGALVLGILERRLISADQPLDRVLVAYELSYGWITVIVGSGAAVLCGCVLAWAIARPLRQLARQLDAMAESGRSKMLSINGVSEFAGLGEAYNRLVMSTSKYLPVRARYIFHSLASGVVAYGTDGIIDTINAAVDEMLELAGRGVGGRSIREVLMDSGRMEELIAVLEEPLARPDSSLSREVTVVTRSGARKTLGVSIASVASAGADSRDIVATLTDLSRMNEISLRMRQAEKLAAIGSLASGVAHEIRNPLASMRALAQLLAEGDDLPAHRREYLRVIVSEVDRLNEVVTRLSDFASPSQQPDTRVLLSDVVRDAVQLVRPQARAKKTSIREDVPDDIAVSGQHQSLVQALLNILVNGVEAAPHGGRLDIECRAGDPVQVRISNDGPPISLDQRARIFDPYHTTKDGSTGLGLAITQQIIVQHGGTIHVEDQPGGGVTFVIELPPLALAPALAHEE